MSALPSRADTCGATSNVRYGPKADIDLSQALARIAASGALMRIAVPAKAYASIELLQDLAAPILEDYARGCTPQYPSGGHEPSCYQRMCIDTLVSARSDPRLYL